MPYSWNGSTHVPYGYRTSHHYPGAWLKTNALQLENYLIAFMQGGEIGGVRILESATVDSMLTIQYPGIDPDQGLAWYRKNYGGRELWGHTGGGYPYGVNPVKPKPLSSDPPMSRPISVSSAIPNITGMPSAPPIYVTECSCVVV